MSPLRFGLYGNNGHQIKAKALKDMGCDVIATAAIPSDCLPEFLGPDSSVRNCPSFNELLTIDELDAISMCSPLRSQQARETILALEAGKHVYAEKPCALEEAELDAIIAAARQNGVCFHEMAGTAFAQPYLAMRESVLAGEIGQVAQVIIEKSYPYHDNRPQDENVDGGLITQCAIHGLRLVEQVSGVIITSIHACESKLGNPVPGGELRMSAVLSMQLKSTATASITANYFNPKGTNVWGHDSLKIIGTKGFIETRDGVPSARLVDGVTARPLQISASGISWLECFVKEMNGSYSFPITLEQELSPTRWAIRAKKTASLAKSSAKT